ncbi:hypothetical protein HETIRDRAFT_456582 [Heterobasidion irregulare TC 32-1]|uniref:Uncharacterized protein n=1 Tax=Heterobasidion irregulare (strain TC 32-1) TaxID=747525 RepID=W4KLA5_HETIT|nr:uncharacterized protein HETIRDRAFT_456582 [Heterobasidion irregulare TC 32-1]ETW86607.1 hypothetical protein HETIRDRAFT_456582 [Heterobasidion irregulare TC 32-1]
MRVRRDGNELRVGGRLRVGTRTDDGVVGLEAGDDDEEQGGREKKRGGKRGFRRKRASDCDRLDVKRGGERESHESQSQACLEASFGPVPSSAVLSSHVSVPRRFTLPRFRPPPIRRHSAVPSASAPAVRHRWPVRPLHPPHRARSRPALCRPPSLSVRQIPTQFRFHPCPALPFHISTTSPQIHSRAPPHGRTRPVRQTCPSSHTHPPAYGNFPHPRAPTDKNRLELLKTAPPSSSPDLSQRGTLDDDARR